MNEKITKLEDTVDLMLSKDHVDRFRAEYHQLRLRFVALNDFLVKWDLGELDFEPKAKRFDLDEQVRNMRTYLATMRRRAENEGIEL
jgi:hypothetical protein